MSAKVTWKQNLSFTGTAGSGFELPLGTSPSVGGDNDGFRPMELLALGLAGCTGMDVISILKKKRQEVSAFEVDVQTKSATEHPHVFTEAKIEYFVTGKNIDEAAVVRAIELSALRYCPAQAMFRRILPIELVYHIYEAGENGARQLVKSGEFVLAEGVG